MTFPTTRPLEGTLTRATPTAFDYVPMVIVQGRLRRSAEVIAGFAAAGAVILCIPFVILAVGIPIALCVRFLLWIVGML